MTLISEMVCQILSMKVIFLMLTPESAARMCYFLNTSEKTFVNFLRQHSEKAPCLLQLQMFDLQLY